MSDFVTPWTVGCQAFLRQEYWNGLPFPSPGDLPDPGIKPTSLALAGGFFSTEPPGKPGRKKKDILLAWQQPSQWETVMTLPMKSHYTSNPQFPPMDILFLTAPTELFLLYKRIFLSFVFQTCRWFTIDSISWVAILCYYWIYLFCW